MNILLIYSYLQYRRTSTNSCCEKNNCIRAEGECNISSSNLLMNAIIVKFFYLYRGLGPFVHMNNQRPKSKYFNEIQALIFYFRF